MANLPKSPVTSNTDTGAITAPPNRPTNSSFVALSDKKPAANEPINTVRVLAVSAGVENDATPLHLNAQFSGHLLKLYAIKAKGHEWQRTYDIPGKKRLREIVGEAYAAFMSIEASAQPVEIFRRLALRLKSDNVKMHADAPKSAIVVRTIFPSLDPNRVYKFARAIEAAKLQQITPSKFAVFVQECGGFEKIRLQPVLSLVPPAPPKKAVPKTGQAVTEADTDDDDVSEAELEALEYGDEIDALLRAKQSAPPIVEATLTRIQLGRIDISLAHRIVLIAQVEDGVLKIYEQVPYFEDALALAYRQSYPTCNDIHLAIAVDAGNIDEQSAQITVASEHADSNTMTAPLALTYSPKV